MCEQIRIKQNQNIQLETSALISLYDEAAEEMMSYLVEHRRKSLQWRSYCWSWWKSS